MKKRTIFILSIIIMIACCPNTHAQATTQPKTMTINEADLPANVLADLKAKEELKLLNQKIKHYGKWVGVGDEVGIAIKQGLFAVKDVAVEFSDTKVGEFTMFLIAWKVVGKDFIRIILGIALLIFGIIFLNRQVRSQFCYQKIPKIHIPLIMRLWTPVEYDIKEPEDYDGIRLIQFIYTLVYIGMFGIIYAIMFA